MTAPSFRLFSLTLLLASLLASPVWFAQIYAPDLQVGHPAIRYFEEPVNNRVSRLAAEIDAGKVKLTFQDGELGYLASLLKNLDINPDSQALVFSKTSFQAPKISPTNPRAIYFGDDTAVAYVRGSNMMEVAVTDPRQGVVFYSVVGGKETTPKFVRGEVCLKCHLGPATMGVPGMFVGSVFPGPAGTPAKEGAIITDHRTEFEDRWGGWYVNAVRGQQKDRSNGVASNPSEPDVIDEGLRQNLPRIIGKFNTRGYLTELSDIVALMTFEHQTQAMNFITRLGWEHRMIEHGGVDSVFKRQFEIDLDGFIQYMFFLEEVRLPEPLQGASTFTETFPKRGARDSKGRSLRDFDLKTRLFRYPFTYTVYSEAFDALPEPVRDRVLRRVYDVLTGADPSPVFAKISSADRTAILEILRETKPNLPAYWKKGRS